MYETLYRKYRPQTFADLVGQDAIARTLGNAIERHRTSHAYLFAGARGTGKTSTARILAKAINCLNRQGGEPCNACARCREISGGGAVDILEIDAASNRGIDEIRDLREKVKYLPASVRMKVYIVDEAHMLTTEAFNALLKTLEEPPPHVMFILATTEPHRLPITVLSRCQRFDFRRISEEAMAACLRRIAEAEGAGIAPEALAACATPSACSTSSSARAHASWAWRRFAPRWASLIPRRCAPCCRPSLPTMPRQPPGRSLTCTPLEWTFERSCAR
jgi:DNA polymerase-3 subunit gamma/tau